MDTHLGGCAVENAGKVAAYFRLVRRNLLCQLKLLGCGGIYFGNIYSHLSISEKLRSRLPYDSYFEFQLF